MLPYLVTPDSNIYYNSELIEIKFLSNLILTKKIRREDGIMYHIYHHNDADGYASAAVIVKHLTQTSGVDREDISTYSCKHGKLMDLSKVNDRDTVYILDYSFSNETDQQNLVSIEKDKEEVDIIWIDHHKSSELILEQVPESVIWADKGMVYTDQNKPYAACMLCWFSIGGTIDSAPMWLKYVDDYDAWKHYIPDSMAFVKGVQSESLYKVFLDPDTSCYANHVSSDAEGITNKYINTGRTILKYDETQNALKMRYAFEVEIKMPYEEVTHLCLACNAKGNSTMFGPHFDLYEAVISFTYDGENWEFNMFSRESGLECDKIAEYYRDKFKISGGGHLHAAGWVAPVNVLTTDMPEIIKTAKIANK